jgi:hypothetical protein
MKDDKKSEHSAIEAFYSESKDGFDKNLKHSEEFIEYTKKLQSTADKLDILNEDMMDFEIDTLSIIAQADTVKEKDRHRVEFGLFIIIALVVLSAYITAGFIFGMQALIISQVILITLMPWIVVPIAVKRAKRGETNG